MTASRPNSPLASTNGATSGPELPTVGERLARLFEICRRRWIVVVSLTMVAGTVAMLVAAGADERYSATAKVLLSGTSIVGSTDPTRDSSSGDPEREINTQIELIKLETVADRVARKLNLDMSREALMGELDTVAEGTTNIVDVTATDAHASRAGAIANAFAREYVALRRRIARSTLREAVRRLGAQLAAIPVVDRGSGEGAALESRLHELETAAATQESGAQVVQRAQTPTSATKPSTLRAGLLGAFFGALLGIAVAALLEWTSRRSVDRGEIHFDSWLRAQDFQSWLRADVGSSASTDEGLDDPSSEADRPARGAVPERTNGGEPPPTRVTRPGPEPDNGTR